MPACWSSICEGIAAKESIEVEPEALALIARAAEGSVRDSLSLLDQAIAHAAGPVRAEDVRQMLGLADRTRIIDLFEALMRGDVAAALERAARAIRHRRRSRRWCSTDLAEFTHFVTRVKIVPAVADDLALIEVERARGRGFAEKLSMRVLSRTWQMLLKGIAEVAGRRPPGRRRRDGAGAHRLCGRPADARRGDPLARRQRRRRAAPQGNGGAPTAASAPVAVRAARRGTALRGAADRRAAWRAARRGRTGGAAGRRSGGAPRRVEPALPPVAVGRFEDLIALAAQKRDLGVKLALERDVRLVRCEDGRLEIALEPSAPKTLVNDLARKFSQWTNRRWMVVVSREHGQPTVKSQDDARQAELKTGVRADPLVQAVLARFPGAEIVDVRKAEAVPQALPPGDPDEPMPEPPPMTTVLPSASMALRTTMTLRPTSANIGVRWRISWA